MRTSFHNTYNSERSVLKTAISRGSEPPSDSHMTTEVGLTGDFNETNSRYIFDMLAAILILLGLVACEPASGSKSSTTSSNPSRQTSPPSITTTSLPSALAGQAYSATLPSAAITGTRSFAATLNLTTGVADASGRSASRVLPIMLSPAQGQTGYGNVGDPYQGRGSDPHAIRISSCTIIHHGGSYRLSRDIGSDQTAVCLTINSSNVTLDLGGFTVTGRIVSVYSIPTPSGLVLFHGNIICNVPYSGTADVGCVRISGSNPLTATLQSHHLTIYNAASTGVAYKVEWSLSSPFTGASFSFRLHDISARMATGSTNRVSGLDVTGTNQTVEYSFNDLSCPNTRTCQPLICYASLNCKIHDNRISMATNTTDEVGRAILIDGHVQGGEVWNNLLIANNNRVLRIRDSMNINVHHNTIKSITAIGSPSYYGAVHLADPDSGGNDLHVVIQNNTFEVGDGTVIVIRDGWDVSAQNNTITCLAGPIGCTGRFAALRSFFTTLTSMSLLSNPSVTVLPAPQTLTESGTTVNLCKSGLAAGSGVVNILPGC